MPWILWVFRQRIWLPNESKMMWWHVLQLNLNIAREASPTVMRVHNQKQFWPYSQFAFNWILLFYVRWMFEMRIDTIIKFVRCQTSVVHGATSIPIKCVLCTDQLRQSDRATSNRQTMLQIKRMKMYAFICEMAQLLLTSAQARETNALLTGVQNARHSVMNFQQLRSIRTHSPVSTRTTRTNMSRMWMNPQNLWVSTNLMRTFVMCKSLSQWTAHILLECVSVALCQLPFGMQSFVVVCVCVLWIIAF